MKIPIATDYTDFAKLTRIEQKSLRNPCNLWLAFDAYPHLAYGRFSSFLRIGASFSATTRFPSRLRWTLSVV